MAISVKQTGFGMRSRREKKITFHFCLWHLTHHSQCTGPDAFLPTHTCSHAYVRIYTVIVLIHTQTYSHMSQTHTNASSIQRMCLVMLLCCFHAYSPVISIYIYFNTQAITYHLDAHTLTHIETARDSIAIQCMSVCAFFFLLPSLFITSFFFTKIFIFY